MNKKQILIVFCLLSWIPALFAVFQYDDHKFLAMPAVQGDIAALQGMFVHGFNAIDTARPLAIATFTANYFLCKDNPMGWIIFNLLIHFTCVYLVYLIVKKITQNEVIAFLVAMLFFVSPIMPFVITYTTQARMEALAAVFVLYGFYLYIQGRKILWVLPCFLGCLCKETAYILPLIILFYSLCFEKIEYKRLFVFLGAFNILFAAGVIYNPGLRLAIFGNDWSLSHGLLGQTQGWMALDILAEYTKRIIWPHPHWLNIDPDYTMYQNWFPLIGIVMLGILYLIYKMREQRNILAFSLLSFFATMVVPIMILPIKPDDKIVIYKTYLACVPVYIFVVVCMERFLNKTIFVNACICIVVLFGMWTFNINQTFCSQVAVWEDAAKENPMRIRPQYNFATAILLEKHDGRRAYEEYKKVIALANKLPAERSKTETEKECLLETWYNMGLLQKEKGQLWKAANCFMQIKNFPLAQERLKEIEKEMAGQL